MKKINSKRIKESSRIESFLTILDIIKAEGRQLTSADIYKIKSSTLGYTRTVLWLKYLRSQIDEGRPYIEGYKYSKRLNPINHQEQFVYFYGK